MQHIYLQVFLITTVAVSMYMALVLRHGLTMQFKLVLNSLCSAGIMGVHHHTWLSFVSLKQGLTMLPMRPLPQPLE